MSSWGGGSRKQRLGGNWQGKSCKDTAGRRKFPATRAGRVPAAPQPALELCPHVRRPWPWQALPRLHINRRTTVKAVKSSYTRTSPNNITPQMDGVSAPQSCVPLPGTGPGTWVLPELPPARLSVLSAGPPNFLCLALKTVRVKAVLGSSQSAWGSVFPTRHCPNCHLSAQGGHWGGTSAQRAHTRTQLTGQANTLFPARQP